MAQHVSGSTIVGPNGRTDVTPWGPKSRPNLTKDDAKFHKILSLSGSRITHFTGSAKGTSGFIIQTAETGMIWPTEGDAIAASALTAKTLYEIGVSKISGSGIHHVIY
jgi:hypothetical protein